MSKTIENLETAFTGESMARSRYMFFARIARKEGFHYIAKIFEETAENEMYHALEEYRLLYGEKTTADNLKEAIKGESYEAEHMYPEFAVQAEIEGDTRASVLFNQIAKIEQTHLERFKNLLTLVETESVYKREKPIRWKCSICGYTYEGHEPPPRCPYCRHAREYCEPANLDV